MSKACLITAYADPSPDTLYKKAVRTRDLSAGIILAKQAYKLAAAQNNNVTEIKSLNLTAEYFWENGAIDSAKFYGQYALKTADRLHLELETANTWDILGLVDYRNGANEAAINKYNTAVVLYEKTHNNLGKALALENIGICESALGRNTDAIANYLTGIKTFEALKDSADVAGSYNSIAICFTTLKDYRSAIEYNNKALAIRYDLHDNEAISKSLNNLGYSYKQLGQPDSAIFYLNKCIAIRNTDKDNHTLILTLQNLGSSWKMKGDFAKAGRYIERSLLIAARYGMKEDIARGNLDLAELYMAEKKYKQALNPAKITEKIVIELKSPDLLIDTYTDEYNLYALNNDYKNAFLCEGKMNKIKDSLFTVAKNKTFSELEIKYQTSQKVKDIAALNLQNKLQKTVVGKQRLFIMALVIAAFLLLLLLLIAWNNFRIKDNANRRIQTLMQDLHHRVKNNLQILSGLFTMQIDELNDESTKNALRENESRLISMNLIHNKLYLDNSSTQIEMADYLNKLLQHVKGSFGVDNVRLRTEINPIMLEADKAVAIGLIVNELATNAFKYAFDGNEGEIYLSLKQENKSRLLLSLGDNGKGLSKSDTKKDLSFGLKLVNLMAKQLSATLVVKNDNGTVYQMVIGI